MSTKQHKKKKGARATNTAFNDLLRTHCPKNLIPCEESIQLLINGGNETVWINLFEITFGTERSEEYRKQVLQEQDMIKKELATIQAAIENLQEDILQTERDIERQVERNDVHSAIQHENLRKDCLLSAFSVACDERCLLLDEICAELKKCMEAPQSSDKTYYQRTDVSDDSRVLLESSCTRSLRLACHAIGNIHNHSIASERTEDMQEAVSRLESLLDSFPPEEVITGLIECVTQGEQRIKHLNESIDLGKDEDELRCLCLDGENWKDLSQTKSAVDVLKHHIQDLQLSHVHSALALERSLQRGKHLKTQLDRLKDQAENNLTAQFGCHGEALQIARSVLRMEMEEVGQTAASIYFKDKYKDLTDQVQEQQSVVLSLKQKELKVKELYHLTESRQRSTKELVKLNTHLNQQLQRQQRDMAQYRRKAICACELGITTLVSSLKNSPLQEIKQFMAVDYPELNYVHWNRSLLHKQHWLITNLAMGDQWCTASSVEQVLPYISTMLRKVNVLQDQLNYYNRSINAATCNNVVKLELLNHLDAIKKEEAQQAATLIRDLQNASSLLDACNDIDSEIHHWWSCPVQGTVPWVTREEMNFQEWKKQWTLLATKLRTLQRSVAPE